MTATPAADSEHLQDEQNGAIQPAISGAGSHAEQTLAGAAYYNEQEIVRERKKVALAVISRSSTKLQYYFSLFLQGRILLYEV